MESLKGGNLITFAEPIAIDAKRGVIVLDQGVVPWLYGDFVTDDVTRSVVEDNHPYKWTNTFVVPFSCSDLDSERGSAACSHEGSLGISDDEAEQMWLEELAHDPAIS